ncbi:hypothetical protein [Rhodopirellula bahusiensis]|uniref:Uncharacterized protein n=1 Tax=Rhodopirellula bahusiensis TaxID=2014065 RepID=A0A2G1W286_9BACT|nr:hypothetical protein [Rhodopirellula bahusiensis]PHQ33133.1 hypothetical protein CEE69_21980 [Rhodopirellula bahusiensis]
MMRDSIESLAQQIEVLRSSIDELKAVFEHAVRNEVVTIRVEVKHQPTWKLELQRGNGNNRVCSDLTDDPLPPSPGELF